MINQKSNRPVSKETMDSKVSNLVKESKSEVTDLKKTVELARRIERCLVNNFRSMTVLNTVSGDLTLCLAVEELKSVLRKSIDEIKLWVECWACVFGAEPIVYDSKHNFGYVLKVGFRTTYIWFTRPSGVR